MVSLQQQPYRHFQRVHGGRVGPRHPEFDRLHDLGRAWRKGRRVRAVELQLTPRSPRTTPGEHLMKIRLAGIGLVAAAALWAAGCDSGGKEASPKVENKGNTELKPLPAPGSPGGGAAPKVNP